MSLCGWHVIGVGIDVSDALLHDNRTGLLRCMEQQLQGTYLNENIIINRSACMTSGEDARALQYYHHSGKLR